MYRIELGMKCRFAEKWYEQCLNFELITDGRFFAPSQPQEGIMGFDAAMFTNNPIFRGLFNTPQQIDHGIVIDPSFWENGRNLNPRELPRLKYNLFIQHKRPEYIKSPRGLEYPDWNNPYFRYDIDLDQQSALSNLERRVHDYSLVVYACPAFWTVEEFTQYYADGELIKNSNFVSASELEGHDRYSFTAGGTDGRVHSKSKIVDIVDIKKEIKRLSEMRPKFEDNKKFIKALANAVSDTINEMEGSVHENFYTLLSRFKQSERNEIENSLATIFSFLLISNSSLLIGYGK